MYVFVCVARKGRAVDPPTSCGAGRSRGCAAGRSRARRRGRGGAAPASDIDSDDEPHFKSYDDDPDEDESPLPPFNPTAPPGFQLPGHFTRAPSPRRILF